MPPALRGARQRPPDRPATVHGGPRGGARNPLILWIPWTPPANAGAGGRFRHDGTRGAGRDVVPTPPLVFDEESRAASSTACLVRRGTGGTRRPYRHAL